jgi:hypothetical protein
MDRTVNTTAPQEGGIGRIDDHVYVELCDVSLYNPDLAH